MDPLDELLGIDPATQIAKTAEELVPVTDGELVEGETVTPAEAAAATPDVKDLEADFDVARKTIKEALEKVGPVLDSAILVAQSGDEPRAYEVVGGLMNSIVDASRKLLTIHESRKKVKDVDKGRANSTVAPPGKAPVHIERAVFVGRASDLLREVKRLQKEVADASEK